MTINQSAQIDGENYIVVNYDSFSDLRRIWILWAARDEFFTARRRNLNLRTIIREAARENVEIIHQAETRPASKTGTTPALRMAKASLSNATQVQKKPSGGARRG